MKTLRENIANGFTLLNLFFGCAAIVQAFNGELDSLKNAGVFILCAGLVDFLDGFVARLLNSESEMGKQLDSLADVVSFGVAPGLICFQILNYSLFYSGHSTDNYRLFVYVSFFIPLTAAYRLAKFNISKEQKYYFLGVPTPAVGIMLASLAIALFYNPHPWLSGMILDVRYLSILIAISGVLMVSKIKIIAMKFKSKELKDNLDKIVLIIGMIIIFLLHRAASGPILFAWYLLVSVYSFYLGSSRHNYL